jgi:polyhydroxyalkanoate synthesis regulator phasin
MNYGMLPPQDVLVILTSKLHAIEREQEALREEVQELRERLAELESSESWLGGLD